MAVPDFHRIVNSVIKSYWVFWCHGNNYILFENVIVIDCKTMLLFHFLSTILKKNVRIKMLEDVDRQS